MMKYITVENDFEKRQYPIGKKIIEGGYFTVEEEYEKIYKEYGLKTHLYFIVFYNKEKEAYEIYETKL